MTDRLDLPRRCRQEIEELLREHVPDAEVWAFGSRVNGTSHEASDLDLVLRGPNLQRLDAGYLDLIEAIEKSNIPILVQAHDWAGLPASLHRETKRAYMVIQGPAGEKPRARAKWREVALGDLVKIKHGFAFKGDYIHDHPQGDVLLTPGNFAIGGGFKVGKPRYFDGKFPEEFVLREGDLIVTMTDLSKQADTLGYPALVPNISDNRRFLHNQRLGKVLIRDGSNVNARYLFYVMCTSEYRHEVLASATGTTVKHTSPDRIKQFRFLLPPLSEQRAIAHVLGTVDEKIELNRRMNGTLEQMARALFKSWFVDFDPVRVKMKGRWRPGQSLPGLPAHLYDLFPSRLVPSELGEIPEGWKAKALETFGGIITGKTPSTKRPEYYGEDVPFLRIPDMHGKLYALQTEVTLSAQGAESQSNKTLPPGSISVSCIATPGLIVLNHRYTQTNQQINSIIPRIQETSSYLFWACRHLSSDIQTGGLGGSVFGNMNKSTFSALTAIHPGDAMICAFDSLVSPIHAAILANEEQSYTLAAQRDALLPKLVSGKVRIGDTERIVANVFERNKTERI